MKCVECGREFEAGDRPDGLPNGVGFQMEDGRIIRCCTQCIITKCFDSMTNGEVVQAVFPNAIAFTLEWWNKPYQKG